MSIPPLLGSKNVTQPIMDGSGTSVLIVPGFVPIDQNEQMYIKINNLVKQHPIPISFK